MIDVLLLSSFSSSSHVDKKSNLFHLRITIIHLRNMMGIKCWVETEGGKSGALNLEAGGLRMDLVFYIKNRRLLDLY